MKRAITLVNTSGGSFADGAGDRIGEALAAAGVDSEIVLVEGKDCAARAADHVKQGVELIIAAGGDGTMGAVAGELAGSKAVMGIMPLGTLNHFARDLGIPFDIAEAAKVVAQAKPRKVDIAEVNGRIFINNASIGLYPLMVMDRDGQRKRLGRSKRLAMLVASLRTMTRFHSRRLTLSTDGGEAKVDTPLLFVGNNDYRVALPAAGRREALDDGELCVMVMRSKSLPGFLAATGRALIGIRRRDDMVRLKGVKELKVDSPRSHLSVAMDGEALSLPPPLTFRIRPRALKVIAPA
ncbi:diacylglycerol/lipid kinase family protein [Sphingomonas alba]|uniref:Diacylglycerol kinase family lipid kinase n=1 Tax=Sphingomonas alba TaxID=2908208 RepID=A0ABT0RNA6_9SPHN|nr:diacylglycerol kinase family protein [Sphingomonas alba]MCL6684043.1 diacylglycerol kinase family lipid kinase [Sphingomonas alba]